MVSPQRELDKVSATSVGPPGDNVLPALALAVDSKKDWTAGLTENAHQIILSQRFLSFNNPLFLT